MLKNGNLTQSIYIFRCIFYFLQIVRVQLLPSVIQLLASHAEKQCEVKGSKKKCRKRCHMQSENICTWEMCSFYVCPPAFVRFCGFTHAFTPVNSARSNNIHSCEMQIDFQPRLRTRMRTHPHTLNVTPAVQPGSISHYNNGKAWGGDLGSREEHTTAAPITMLYCFSPSRMHTCAPVCTTSSACMHLCLRPRLNASRTRAFVHLPETYAATSVVEDGMCRMWPRGQREKRSADARRDLW